MGVAWTAGAFGLYMPGKTVWTWSGYGYREKLVTRIAYIKAEKPKSEQKVRLKLFRLIPEDRIPPELERARAEYGKARAEYDKARAECVKVGDEYDKARAEGVKVGEEYVKAG